MDWLKCSICLSKYNESSQRPRSLCCGHSFCESCLHAKIQNETITCPRCRKVIEIISVCDIPVNYDLEGIVKSLNSNSDFQNEESISRHVDGEADSDTKSKIKDSLRSRLDQQERSLAAQKDLMKSSAGMCNEHPGNDFKFRCSLHKCWVCEQCMQDHGDHPKNKCQIRYFKEEIEARKQEHKRSIDNEGKFCDASLSTIETHMSNLRDGKENHKCLVNKLQNLVKIHKKGEETLLKEIISFRRIVEKGKRIKQSVLGIEPSALNAVTLDESNSARDELKIKTAKARHWGELSHKKVEAGKLVLQRSAYSAMATKTSIEYRENNFDIQKYRENNFDIEESDITATTTTTSASKRILLDSSAMATKTSTEYRENNFELQKSDITATTTTTSDSKKSLLDSVSPSNTESSSLFGTITSTTTSTSLCFNTIVTTQSSTGISEESVTSSGSIFGLPSVGTTSTAPTTITTSFGSNAESGCDISGTPANAASTVIVFGGAPTSTSPSGRTFGIYNTLSTGSIFGSESTSGSIFDSVAPSSGCCTIAAIIGNSSSAGIFSGSSHFGSGSGRGFLSGFDNKTEVSSEAKSFLPFGGKPLSKAKPQTSLFGSGGNTAFGAAGPFSAAESTASVFGASGTATSATSSSSRFGDSPIFGGGSTSGGAPAFEATSSGRLAGGDNFGSGATFGGGPTFGGRATLGISHSFGPSSGNSGGGFSRFAPASNTVTFSSLASANNTTMGTNPFGGNACGSPFTSWR